MRKNDIVYPSFESAQALYMAYSTIAVNNVLNKKLHEYIDDSYLKTLEYKNVRDAYNQIILQYYPNESCIKAEFINRVLSKGKTHVTIFEMPVGGSRADLCKVNGTSTAYEIKTDLDNFTRLRKQIRDYLLIFEYVYVICSEHRVEEVKGIVPDECGIYVYHKTNRGTYCFNLFRKACVSKSVNSKKQLEILRKNEFSEYYNVNIFEYSREEAIKKVLSMYDSYYINKQFKSIIKERYLKQWSFLRENLGEILEIDYQWFFGSPINPSIIYS